MTVNRQATVQVSMEKSPTLVLFTILYYLNNVAAGKQSTESKGISKHKKG